MSAHMVVLKFSMERPDFQTIRSCIIKDWNLEGGFEMSLIDLRHVTIWFDEDKELDLSLARSYRSFIGISFKIFFWRPRFRIG